MEELTFKEGLKLRRVLKQAFPSRLAMAQVVFDKLEKRLDRITEAEEYGEILLYLIQWAEYENKTPDLIEGARSANPSDEFLLDFDQEYRAKRSGHQGVVELPPPVLSNNLRRDVVNLLLRLPGADNYGTRSALLSGLPGTIQRDATSARTDFDLVLNQLNQLGRTSTGTWSLLLFIDNALPYFEGFDLSDDLLQIRQTLEVAYDEA